MTLHRISFETMNFVSKGGTDGIDGFDTREETGHAWMDAVMGQGLKVSNMKASPWDLATWIN